jgi:hypothetical protein
MRNLTFLLVCLLGVVLVLAEEQTCSWNKDEPDPALKEMTYDVGDGEKTFMAYVEPDVTTFYQGTTPPASTKVVPKFNGLSGKFINMSNKSIRLYWEPHEGGQPSLMRYYKPFSSGGTASFAGHRFFFTPDDDPKTRLDSFIVSEYPANIYVYNPYKVDGDPKQTEANLAKALSKAERKNYKQWTTTLSFHEQYLNFTGRSYLANYLRAPPSHHMWRADYFGQEHWVTTKETHFVTVPPQDDLDPITARGKKRILKEDDPRLLAEYRVKDQVVMNMTMKALSCAPRVFEIPNFLSQAEVDHILHLAGGIDLAESTTGDVGQTSKKVSVEDEKLRKTRTSKNTWVKRKQSPIIDAIYRRSADLLRIDESLLRYRDKSERPDVPTQNGIAESLQLVHYDPKQEVSLSCL